MNGKEEEMMVHVIAFDVSMGKSIMVIYDKYQRCVYEGELEHTVAGFESLKERIEAVREVEGRTPEIVFEATGVYSQGLERFLQDENYSFFQSARSGRGRVCHLLKERTVHEGRCRRK